MESTTVPARPQQPVTRGRLLDFSEDPVTCMRELYETHGTIAALEEEGQRIYFIFGPEYNQRVLSDSKTFHSRFFAVRGPRNSAQRRVTSGLLSMNEGEHKEHRRMVMGPFQKRSITHYLEPTTELVNEMLDDWKPGQTRDIHEEMTQYMLRVTSAILFGLNNRELAYRVGALIDEWVHLNHEMGIGAFLSDPQFSGRYDELLSMAEKLEVDIREMIAVRRAGLDRGNDVLSLLIQAHDSEGRVDDEKLVGHVALLFGAAHLTTAHSLTWTLFLLAQHPSVARQVYDEICDVVAGDSPTLEELGRMPITDRAIRESMRVLPASGYSQRIASEPVELGPFKINRGNPIVFSQFITHHMPELYDDPEAYRPDRWLSIDPSPYAYLPFGSGPRMCLGAPLAMMTIKTTLPTILKRYRLTMQPNAEVSGRIVSTMLGPTTSVPMLVSAADGKFQAQPVRGNIHNMVRLDEMPVAKVERRAA